MSDCISRQAVQTELKNCEVVDMRDENDDFVGYYNADTVDSIVRNLPPVNPQEPKWIPVDAKLPKNDEDVLVCFPQGGMAVAYYHIDDVYYPTQYADLNETGWFNEEGDAFYFEPIAWMPLPPCYEPQESEDKEWMIV